MSPEIAFGIVTEAILVFMLIAPIIFSCLVNR